MHRTSHPRLVDTFERSRVLAALNRPGGGIVEVAAEPGMGKSRIVVDVDRVAREQGLQVRCLRFGRFGPTAPAAADAVRSRVDAAHRLWAVATGCEVSREAEPAVVRQTPPPGKRVLLVDDAHWGDQRTLDLLEGMIEETADPREGDLLVVLTHRPRQSSRQLRTMLAVGVERGVVERIELAPFTLAQSADLVGLSADDEWLDRLHRESEGVPLYLLALAYMYLARSTTEPDPFGAQIPRQVAALLSGELATLGPAEAAMLRAGAVLGDRFELEAVTDVAGLAHDEALAAVTELVRRDVVRETEQQTVFAFRHRLLRQVVYVELEVDARAQVHRAALEVLEGRGAGVVQRAVHLERLADRRRPEDVQVLVTAARECKVGDPDAAARFLEAALRGRNRPERRAELILLLAKTLAGVRLVQARDVLLPLLGEHSGASSTTRAQAVAFSATLDALSGRATEADAVIASELAALPDDPPPAVAELLLARGLIALTTGGTVGTTDIDLAFRLARRHGSGPAQVVALVLRAYRGAVECARSGVDGAENQALWNPPAVAIDRLADAGVDPGTLVLLGWSEVLVSRQAQAERHLRRAAAVVESRGPRLLAPLANICLSVVLQRRGRHAEAGQAAAVAHRTALELDAGQFVEVARALQAQCGEQQDGGAGVAGISTLPMGQGWLGLNAATFLASAGELDSDIRRSVALIIHNGGGRDLPDLPAILRPRCYEVLTLETLAQGEGPSVAAEWADRAHEAAEALDLPCQRAYALLARAHLTRARGDLMGAAELYRRAGGLFGASEMNGAQARAFGHAAECATEAGQVDYARSLLVLAKAMARQCGAGQVYLRLDAQLRDLDAPARTEVAEADTALNVLTEREREIAGIAGQGKRTKDIAAQLSLSPRTVDVHLGRIYRKLNIESRAELARIVAEAS